MSPDRCATDPGMGEFTLCGDAFDAFDTDDADAPIIFAKPGQTITCERCRRIIDYCKSLKRYKA